MQGSVPGRNNDNAEVAVDLRRRMARPLLWGLPVLGLGLVGGAACLAAVFLVPGQSTLVFCSVAGSLSVLVGLAGLGLALLQRTRWQRSLALIAFADELGLSFQELAAPHLYEGLRRLEMFSASSGIRVSNVLFGEVEGLTVAVMDCIVSAGQGESQFYFENTVFVLRHVPRRVPDFYLTPHDFLSRKLSRDSRRIEIPKQPEFNKRLLLKGADEEAILQAFNTDMIAHFLAGGDQNVEVHRPLFVVQQRGKRLPPTRYREFIRHCVRLAQALGISAEA